MSWRKYSILISLSFFSPSAPSADQTTPDNTVFYTANRQGEIDPCGCQRGQIGGLNQMASFLADARSKLRDRILLLDSGDTFFSAPLVNPLRQVKELLRAEVIADTYRDMKVDAMVPGDRDLAFGAEIYRALAKRSAARVIATNLFRKGAPVFSASWRVERGGVNYLITGLVDEGLAAKFPDSVVESPETALAKHLAVATRERVDQIIVLSHLGLERDRKIADRFPGMWILGSHSQDILNEPEKRNRTWIFQPQNEGQQIGRIHDRGSAFDPETALIDLIPQWDKPGPVKKRVSDFNEKMRQRGLATPPVAKAEKSAFVAHPFACRQCHEKQYDFWATTKHSSAYLALYAKNQNLDPDCIGCHSLGFQAPGGFDKITQPIVLAGDSPKGALPFIENFMQKVFADAGDQKVALDSRTQTERYRKLHAGYTDAIHDLERRSQVRQNFLGVQCEHCHGVRLGHPGTKTTVKKVDLQNCRNCHRAPNAPEFDPKSVAKIACPRLGQ